MVISKRESAFIKTNYDFIDIETKGSLMFCYGKYQPTPYSPIYKFRIKYNPYVKPPVVTISEPQIAYSDDIHMYPKDNSLCLYHKSDLIWDTNKHHLYDTIIPWTIEWIVFYELYLISGVWEHPYVPHKLGKKK